jgi:hypothetical protein
VSLAAVLEGGDGDTGAVVTPMGELAGRPGTLLAAVATPPGWAGRVTVRVDGGGGDGGAGVGAPSLAYNVAGGALPPPASRRGVTVTGVGLGGAMVVTGSGERE